MPEINPPATIIDVHVHAFPDALAERALAKLCEGIDFKPFLDGTTAGLLASMDRAGIAQAWVANIATRPEQFDPILAWSRAIASERLRPLPSVHPDDPLAAARVRQAAEAGFHGIKLHPYYQCFAVDEPRLAPIYDAVREHGLVLLMHAGFDISFPLDRICDPERIARVAEAWPGLKLIAAHLGAWRDWDEVERHLIGRPVYLDLSMVLPFLPDERARAMLLAHPADRLLFGTDSPWADQARAIEAIRRLDLGPEHEDAIFHVNAERLLASARAAAPSAS